jgi:hypothetical protein
MSLPIVYGKMIKVGDQNGTLVVIETPRRVVKGIRHSGYWMVWVKCSCGHKQNVPCHKWIKKEFSVCRHCKIGGNKHYKWSGVGEMPGYAFYKTIQNSRRIGVSHTISKNYLWNLFLAQKGKCALSGIDIVFHSQCHDKQTASVDRIDSSKGYVEGNVQWIHKDINKMKNEYPQDYYIKLCQMVAILAEGNACYSNGIHCSKDTDKQ